MESLIAYGSEDESPGTSNTKRDTNDTSDDDEYQKSQDVKHYQSKDESRGGSKYSSSKDAASHAAGYSKQEFLKNSSRKNHGNRDYYYKRHCEDDQKLHRRNDDKDSYHKHPRKDKHRYGDDKDYSNSKVKYRGREESRHRYDRDRDRERLEYDNKRKRDYERNDYRNRSRDRSRDRRDSSPKSNKRKMVVSSRNTKDSSSSDRRKASETLQKEMPRPKDVHQPEKSETFEDQPVRTPPVALHQAVASASAICQRRAIQKVNQLERLGINLPTVVTATSTSTEPVDLPKYYNPGAINPAKYAERMQKRKLLWSHKKDEDTLNKWNNTKFAQDADGKVASKFMRLMGIKDTSKVSESEPVNTVKPDTLTTQEEMFNSMEQQYEMARQATHTMRGVGLGFSSQSKPF